MAAEALCLLRQTPARLPELGTLALLCVGSLLSVTVKNSSSISGNTAPVGFGADAYNLGVLDLDNTSTIGTLDGNPAVLI